VLSLRLSEPALLFLVAITTHLREMCRRTGQVFPFTDLGELSGCGASRVRGESFRGLGRANRGAVREELLTDAVLPPRNLCAAWAASAAPLIMVVSLLVHSLSLLLGLASVQRVD
jgi:hypothetical protein